jgi:hypothetical protein
MAKKIHENNKVTEKTAEQYLLKTTGRIKTWQCHQTKFGALGEGPVGYVRWLIDIKKPQLLADSWHYYKSSSCWTMDPENCDLWSDYDPILVNQAFGILSVEPQQGCASHSDHTSTNKMKRLRKKDVDKLELHMAKSKSPLAVDLIAYLKAGKLAGVRPIEWFDACELETIGAPN